MIKWFKERTRQEKWMLALIAVLLIGVVVRWGFIKKEAGDAFRHRIDFFKPSGKPNAMKLKNIYSEDRDTKIFLVTNWKSENELKWTIVPTELELIPDDENVYIVRAKQVMPNAVVDCYIYVMMPERIAETVFKKDAKGKTVAEPLYESPYSVIPAVASEGFGAYYLYRADENPQIGIDILSEGLGKAKNKWVVASDLGYLLRDEGRIEEAIESFRIVEEYGENFGGHIYAELSQLYEKAENKEEHLRYRKLYENSGESKIDSSMAARIMSSPTP